MIYLRPDKLNLFMKVIFWLSSIVVIFSTYLFLQGYINVYIKNYNGGPSSSSGSIRYYLFGSIAILLTGVSLYLMDKLALAAMVMALPVGCALMFIIIRMFIPLLMGERMN